MANAINYTPGQPPQNPFNLSSLNALGDPFAANYGYPVTDLIIKDLRPMIFDSAPKEFYDLTILNSMKAQRVNNDVFNWLEKPYGRDAYVCAATSAITGGGSQITIPVQPGTINAACIDTLVGFPNGTQGNILTINTSLNTITIQMMANVTAPTVNPGDIINNLAPLEADATSMVSSGGFRIQTLERYNYVSILARGMQWGTRELEKMKRSGTTNYLEMNYQEMMRQFRVDISNLFWLGTAGMCKLANGATTKVNNGVWSFLQQSGSPIIPTPLASVGAAIEAALLATEYGNYGQLKMLYMTPSMARAVCTYYKDSLVRYVVTSSDPMGSTMAPLELNSINIGSSKAIIVPMQRFQDTTSFPVTFQDTIFGLDTENIIPAYFMDEYTITTPDRRSGINERTSNSTIISGDFSMYFYNPLSSFAIVTS